MPKRWRQKRNQWRTRAGVKTRQCLVRASRRGFHYSLSVYNRWLQNKALAIKRDKIRLCNSQANSVKMGRLCSPSSPVRSRRMGLQWFKVHFQTRYNRRKSCNRRRSRWAKTAKWSFLIKHRWPLWPGVGPLLPGSNLTRCSWKLKYPIAPLSIKLKTRSRIIIRQGVQGLSTSKAPNSSSVRRLGGTRSTITTGVVITRVRAPCAFLCPIFTASQRYSNHISPAAVRR